MALLTNTDVGSVDDDVGFLGIGAAATVWGAQKVYDKLKKKKRKKSAPVAEPVKAPPPPPPKPKLSTGAMVGIGVAGVALLLGVFMLLTKKKKAA